MVSAYWEPQRFELPPPPGGPAALWHRLIEIALDPPEDMVPPEESPAR